MIRLVASDLDGTLLRSDGTLSDRTRRALRRTEARGIRIVLVTARPPRVARLFAQAAGTSGLLICCNGALVYDVQRDAIIRHSPIDARIAERLIELIRRASPDTCFAAEVGTSFAQERAWARLASEIALEPHDVEPDDVHEHALLLCREPITKLLVRHPVESIEVLAALVRELAGDLVAVTHSGGPFVEMSAAGVHKAFALEALCGELNVCAADVLAFGDMPNDLPMLSWAGRGIAVANAHPDVRDAADELTDSNDDDGVAAALERLLLGG